MLSLPINWKSSHYRIFATRMPPSRSDVWVGLVGRTGILHRNVTDGGVEHTKHLVFKTGLRNRITPFQISGYGPFLQSVAYPCLCHCMAFCPPTWTGCFLQSIFRIREDGGRSFKRWSVFFTSGATPHVEQRGDFSSVGQGVFRTFRMSPRTPYPQEGHVPRRSGSARTVCTRAYSSDSVSWENYFFEIRKSAELSVFALVTYVRNDRMQFRTRIISLWILW